MSVLSDFGITKAVKIVYIFVHSEFCIISFFKDVHNLIHLYMHGLYHIDTQVHSIPKRYLDNNMRTSRYVLQFVIELTFFFLAG